MKWLSAEGWALQAQDTEQFNTKVHAKLEAAEAKEAQARTELANLRGHLRTQARQNESLQAENCDLKQALAVRASEAQLTSAKALGHRGYLCGAFMLLQEFTCHLSLQLYTAVRTICSGRTWSSERALAACRLLLSAIHSSPVRHAIRGFSCDGNVGHALLSPVLCLQKARTPLMALAAIWLCAGSQNSYRQA